ncbi:BatD family protein [Methylotuvimicrobium sp. KM1]|uniref:BatD family protein n=1 Tax=Methylotuvimicrobium sp. KM1 TaxID=3377707 RepID=UPI00384A4E9D
MLMLIVFSLFATFKAQAANIDVTVDRSPVGLNESFQITFIADETPDDQPDFAPLEKDFEILGRSQSSSTSIINGQYSKTQQWKLSVMAKRGGELTIPAIAFGKDRSNEVSLMVTETGSREIQAADDDLFLEVEATPENPYVQSQVLYTLRFYRRVSITQARLSEPELDNAVIEKLGEDSNYTTQIGGIGYQVTERKYAIFPQQSGTMTIAPLQLDAEVITGGQSRFNGFFNRQSTKLKRINSKPITLEIKPIPETFIGAHWLAAENLSLSQEWSGNIARMRVGEPLTRTLRIAAQGATVGQLPELHKQPKQTDLKTYPDQPVLNENKDPEGIKALREEKIAFIPGKAGQYTLPAIEISWFNTRTGQVEIAKLPETTVIAEGAMTANELPPPASIAEFKVQADTASSKSPPQSSRQSDYWMWAALFCAVGWLATGLYFGLRRPVKSEGKVQDPIQQSLSVYVKSLKKACAENDSQAAKNALIGWGREKYKVASLGDLANHCEARLRDEIMHLNACLYSADRLDWQGKKLFQAFSEHKAREQFSDKPVDNELEPLYRL